MSDVQKPVEETPAAAPAVAPATEAPAATETPATETPAAEEPKETPAETTEAAAPAAAEESKTEETPAEQPKEEPKQEEVTPASEGVLGYKAPGLVKGLRFAKRFFYFSDDAVESKQLSAFHQNEKAAVANPIAAWASQTGKGLLFFTKRAEDKASPAGIFNLADVSDIAKEGSTELHFKVNGQKHTFQASSTSERDSWIAALEAKAAEAKAEKEAVTSSEGYKAELEKLSKPAVAEPAKKAEPKEEAAPAEDKKEDKAASKSRSQSRKRASIFGTLLGKKEEAKEEAAPEEKKEEKEEKKAETPAPKSKRASLFGNFFQKVTSPSHEKSEKEATAPAETAVASTAPQLDNPVEEAAVKPIEPESVTAPAEAEAAKDAAPVSPAAETPKDKRRTSFFGNFGKKKGDSDNEGADGEPKPKGNKLGGIFRKPSKAVKSEPKEATEAEAAPKEATVQESPAEESAKPAEAAPAEESKPVDVATSTPVQAAA
ncbi:hypothetical protein BO83DRAFT_240804 [Aspergillus eucalypticola CBS 122712]|uniref:PH domain-containing protein n=1 Tax=Aspergillus eucalypticola (strain CBS 122712 / IBT 29274) TaxID=1448314 RepID=A0A317VRB0_ASPEC|nr:uncharacterized protein BO83DRAFT_240804 [Aspergillus eucalypticola CBS 122712]PWY76846.1 hypothetical protein BO83DRAFT_240804 [Aspergillus eucalypticola CBS 122712]